MSAAYRSKLVTSSYEWNPKQTNRAKKISSVWNADLWLGSHIRKIAPIKMETKQHNKKWDFPFKKDHLNDNKIYKTWYKSWHKYLFLRVMLMTFIVSVNHTRLPIRNAWRKLFLDVPCKLSPRTLQYRDRNLFGLCRWIYRRILWRRLVDMYIFISLIRSYFVSLNEHR